MVVDARPGDPHRLGATWDGERVNFAVFSTAGAHGGDVSLSLFDPQGAETRVPLFADGDVWHASVGGVGPEQLYGYRATGPHAPDRGLLFDPGAVLLDPYARAMTPPEGGGPRTLRSLVVDEAFDWSGDTLPRRPWADTVLYEVHVKGMTMRHPGVPEALRGTYAGLAHPTVIGHLVDLGVTAVELLPVHQFLTEQFLIDRGLTNYWGYSTIGFFAPHGAYSSAGTRGGQVADFKRMVGALHAAGLEVILDVVYNHTAEGSGDQPALCFRGLANDVYYRLDPGDPSRYIDTTGTGNTMHAGAREVLRLILDSLRYWATAMHVDGFRFDLAATLAREEGGFDRLASFFDIVYQDPVVGRLKLIAEPWDVNAYDSYQLGRFPAGWNEWNDRYRDTVRDFWRGRGGVTDLGWRLTGSQDLYGVERRGPDTSVNFVTAHDGKTLADLVSYEGKHNEANGEDNRDGTPNDRAANYGVEGPTTDPGILAVRARQRRNMLATLLLSQGVPMILGGDELGRTQHGNNNAYCQDNPISWFDWTPSPDAASMTSFVRRLVAVQMAHPALRRRSFLTGAAQEGAVADIAWYDSEGTAMSAQAWNDPSVQFIAYLLAGDRVDAADALGRPQSDTDVLVMINASTQEARFRMPGRPGTSYTVVVDTGEADGSTMRPACQAGDVLAIPARTVLAATAPVVR